MIYITYLVLGFGLCSGAVAACGGGLVRVFNTQPVLVARYEAGTPEGLRRICTAVKKPWGVSLRLKNGNSPPDMV